MRTFFLVVVLAAGFGIRPAAAQRASASTSAANISTDSAPQERIALSSRRTADDDLDRQPMRLACAPLIGQVFEPNGHALVGATLLVKGTHQVYVTDSEGKFQLTETIFQGQTLAIGAAGYTTQEVTLDDCTLPRLVLERIPGARIKRTGKRAGQVVRLNKQSTNLK